jgi:hypothetical protein
MLSAFRQGLAGTGYAKEWADGDPKRLRQLAEDFVRRRVAVIVAAEGEDSILAAKGATFLGISVVAPMDRPFAPNEMKKVQNSQ